jgi:hypothetical protein
MKWITRERPKIDRIACPWLISRFIDDEAEVLFAPAAEVARLAAEVGATPYDVPGVALTHVWERCSFDAFIAEYRLGGDRALSRLATIVRGADTDRLGLTPQSAGLYAISLGLSRLYRDDQQMLRQGLVIFDALCTWCRDAQHEKHGWSQHLLQASAGASSAGR